MIKGEKVGICPKNILEYYG